MGVYTLVSYRFIGRCDAKGGTSKCGWTSVAKDHGDTEFCCDISMGVLWRAMATMNVSVMSMLWCFEDSNLSWIHHFERAHQFFEVLIYFHDPLPSLSFPIPLQFNFSSGRFYILYILLIVLKCITSGISSSSLHPIGTSHYTTFLPVQSEQGLYKSALAASCVSSTAGIRLESTRPTASLEISL